MRKYLVVEGGRAPQIARVAEALRDMEADREFPQALPGPEEMEEGPETDRESVCPEEVGRWLEAVWQDGSGQNGALTRAARERVERAARLWIEAQRGAGGQDKALDGGRAGTSGEESAPQAGGEARRGPQGQAREERPCGEASLRGRTVRFVRLAAEIAARMERLGADGIVHGPLPLSCTGLTEPAALEICCSCGLRVAFCGDANGAEDGAVSAEDAAFFAVFGKDMDCLTGEWQICRVGTDGQASPLRLLLAERCEDREEGGAFGGRREEGRAKDGRAAEGSGAGKGEDASEVWVLETNIDDATGEQLGYAVGLLMKAGARDASAIPVLMKKNRPAFLLQVICTEEKVDELEDLIFRETTSIGLRKYREKRKILERRFERLETCWGPVQYKVCEHHGELYYYPEYEDVAAVCRRTGKSFQEVLRALRKK